MTLITLKVSPHHHDRNTTSQHGFKPGSEASLHQSRSSSSRDFYTLDSGMLFGGYTPWAKVAPQPEAARLLCRCRTKGRSCGRLHTPDWIETTARALDGATMAGRCKEERGEGRDSATLSS